MEPNFERESEPFVIKHFTSGKFIHPLGGSTQPDNETRVVVYEGYHDACWFTWIPLHGMPGMGLIKHYSSGKFLQPLGGEAEPYDNTEIVIQDGYGQGSAWTFNTEFQTISHIGGKYWHPYWDYVNPENDSTVSLYHYTAAGTHFAPVNAEGQILNLQDAKIEKAKWKCVYHTDEDGAKASGTVSYNFSQGFLLKKAQDTLYSMTMAIAA